MLLVLGDVHCQFDVINAQLQDASLRFGERPREVLQLGDLGFYPRRLAQFFDTQQRRLDTHVHFIDGNHEDFFRLDALTRRYAAHFTHLPRCSTFRFQGARFLLLGGASYMDPVNTPPGSVISRGDVERCLAHPADSIDIVASHDCPCGIGVQGKEGFGYCGEPGFSGSRRILDRFAPRLWFFAHHHAWFDADDGRTRFHGLAPAWEGYAVLDEGGQVTLVQHHVEAEPALSQPCPGPWGALLWRRRNAAADKPASLWRRLFNKACALSRAKGAPTPGSHGSPK